MVFGQVTTFILAFFFLSEFSAAKTNQILYSHTRLIEVFSSESCSSCPPADKWVSELKSNPGLWIDFIPVVYHVDYWNYLDWKDPFSNHEMTQRQIDIVKTWKNGNVYTPAVVLNGKEWKGWGSKQIPKFESKSLYKLELKKNSSLDYEVFIKGPALNKYGYVLRAALLGFEIESTVTAGENKGKNLIHNFLVLDWQYQNLKQFTAPVRFKFLKPDKKVSELSIAVWLEERFIPIPLQSVAIKTD